MSGYAVNADGGWRTVNSQDDCTTSETYSEKQPAPYSETPAGKAALHKVQIQAQLDALDAASARPLRAIMAAQAAGKTTAAADLTKLADLEAQAVALRTELAGLGA